MPRPHCQDMHQAQEGVRNKTSLTVRRVSERHLLPLTRGGPTTKYPLLQFVYFDSLYVHVEFVTQNEFKWTNNSDGLAPGEARQCLRQRLFSTARARTHAVPPGWYSGC
jgi:hypothetical protein